MSSVHTTLPNAYDDVCIVVVGFTGLLYGLNCFFFLFPQSQRFRYYVFGRYAASFPPCPLRTPLLSHVVRHVVKSGNIIVVYKNRSAFFQKIKTGYDGVRATTSLNINSTFPIDLKRARVLYRPSSLARDRAVKYKSSARGRAEASRYDL